MYSVGLSNLSWSYLHPWWSISYCLAHKQKIQFLQQRAKTWKKKLSFIIPDKIPLYGKGKVILYFTYPKNNVSKAAKPLFREEYFSTPVQLLSDNASITPLQAFISQNMGVCSVKHTKASMSHQN